MRQDSVFSTRRYHSTPRFTTSALTLRSEETALRGQPRRLPRRGKGGAADRGAALHEVEFPIKRKPGQTCASLRPGRLPYNDRPGRPRAPMAAGVGPLHTTMKRPSAASSPAFPARAVKAALFGCSPHRRAKPRRSPARRASSWGLRAAPYAPPLARPRAPLAAFGAKARANDRGLARNKEGASLYASVFVLRSGSGNTAGNSAKRGTGQLRSDNIYIIVSCPFPAVLLRHCARSVPDIF